MKFTYELSSIGLTQFISTAFWAKLRLKSSSSTNSEFCWIASDCSTTYWALLVQNKSNESGIEIPYFEVPEQLAFEQRLDIPSWSQFSYPVPQAAKRNISPTSFGLRYYSPRRQSMLFYQSCFLYAPEISLSPPFQHLLLTFECDSWICGSSQ